MLTKEIIQANESLKGLSDEQLVAIATLSENDETQTIGKKVADLHGKYEADVLITTGIPKNTNEKSYDYVKRILGDYKGKAETLPTQIEALKTEVEGYKKQISEGKGSEVIAKQLKDAEALVKQLKDQYDSDKTDWTKKETDWQTKYNAQKLDYEFAGARTALKFKKDLSDEITGLLIQKAQENILAAYKPDWVEKEGKNVLIFRDAAGNIATNPENKLEPFTPAELLKKQLKDALDTSKVQTGTGTKPVVGATGLVDISSAKNQVEADELIDAYLLKQGLLRYNPEFGKEQLRIRKELGVSKLSRE